MGLGHFAWRLFLCVHTACCIYVSNTTTRVYMSVIKRLKRDTHNHTWVYTRIEYNDKSTHGCNTTTRDTHTQVHVSVYTYVLQPLKINTHNPSYEADAQGHPRACQCHRLRHTQCVFISSYCITANPTWGKIFESSKLKARTSLLPRFSEKRRSSFELWALKQHSKMSPQVELAVLVCIQLTVCIQRNKVILHMGPHLRSSRSRPWACLPVPSSLGRGGGLGSSTIREVGGWGRGPFSRI